MVKLQSASHQQFQGLVDSNLKQGLAIDAAIQVFATKKQEAITSVLKKYDEENPECVDALALMDSDRGYSRVLSVIESKRAKAAEQDIAFI